jgi:hypothetical protein
MDGMAVEVELVLFATTTKERKKNFFRSLAKKFLDSFNPVKLHLAPRFYYMSKHFITLHHPCKNQQGIGHGLGIIK